MLHEIWLSHGFDAIPAENLPGRDTHGSSTLVVVQPAVSAPITVAFFQFPIWDGCTINRRQGPGDQKGFTRQSSIDSSGGVLSAVSSIHRSRNSNLCFDNIRLFGHARDWQTFSIHGLP